MTTIATLPAVDSAALVGWTITGLLTFILIGLPTLYLLVLASATDDEWIDRAAHDISQYVALQEKAAAYAAGKDILGVLDKPLELAPLASTGKEAGPALTKTAPEEEQAQPRNRRGSAYPIVGSPH